MNSETLSNQTKHFRFWFLEPELLNGFYIANVGWTEIYQSYLKKKKSRKT